MNLVRVAAVDRSCQLSCSQSEVPSSNVHRVDEELRKSEGANERTREPEFRHGRKTWANHLSSGGVALFHYQSAA